MKDFLINEIFYSLQGEGIRAGSANVFIRFSGCNLKCDIEEGPLSPGGFACDTEFASGKLIDIDSLLNEIKIVGGSCRSVILSGGEPGLQITADLVKNLQDEGYFIAVETNGTIKLPVGIDWVTVSPKVAEHAIKQTVAQEVKYIRHYGQGIPKTQVEAKYNLISPAAQGDRIPKANLEWCIKLVKENPQWRLSTQQHKNWGVR